MKEIAKSLQRLIPKEMDTLKRRYDILNCIQLYQPVGRRSIAQRLDLSEKSIRSDTEYFKSAGFIHVTSLGMEIEPSGNDLLERMKEFIKHLEGLSNIEEKVRKILDCEELLIVSGDADYSDEAKINMANAAAKILLDHIQYNSIIALTGGSTIHKVIHQLKPTGHNYPDVIVVPARGSLGNNIEFHANTLASVLAKKMNSQYRLLNIPDNLSQKALKSVRQEPDIQQTIEAILKANIIIYGIGNVEEMAIRRSLDTETKQYLQDHGAVAEVLGYYFDKFGQVVYTSRSIGVSTDEMKDLNFPIAVAGGASKAEAILAVRKFVSKGCLIIDEGAAKRIIEVYEAGYKVH